MEMFVRYLLVFTTPVIQLALVIWRVQFKIRIPLIGIAIFCFILGITFSIWAGTIFPDLLAKCIGCAPPAGNGTKGLYVIFVGFFVNIFFNIVFSLLGFVEYKAALKRRAIRDAGEKLNTKRHAELVSAPHHKGN